MVVGVAEMTTSRHLSINEIIDNLDDESLTMEWEQVDYLIDMREALREAREVMKEYVFLECYAPTLSALLKKWDEHG